MKPETSDEIIERMADIYATYRSSRYNEDWSFPEWLVNMKIGDEIIDLFIAAEDWRDEGVDNTFTPVEPASSHKIRTGANAEQYCQCTVSQGDGIVCSKCGKYLW